MTATFIRGNRRMTPLPAYDVNSRTELKRLHTQLSRDASGHSLWELHLEPRNEAEAHYEQFNHYFTSRDRIGIVEGPKGSDLVAYLVPGSTSLRILEDVVSAPPPTKNMYLFLCKELESDRSAK
eukprot:GHVU01082960.1.p1 GENE.GHVU01082960.1~~GHVU01082960.1.p1  ORF type:complete len:124 (+),score=16.34 GHVU01082960.1:107-478(+)